MLARLGSLHVQFQYYAVMNQPINGGSGCHRILEDHLPFTERQIARYQNAAPLVPVGKQRKQYLSV